MVYVADGAGEVIGWGALNMTSIFRVRVFVFQDQAEDARRSGDNDDDGGGDGDGDGDGDDRSHQQTRDCDLEALIYHRLADAIRLR